MSPHDIINLPRRSLSYAKIVQVECNEACFKLPRRSLSYAKIRIINVTNEIILNYYDNNTFL